MASKIPPAEPAVEDTTPAKSTRTRSQIGKANLAKSKERERQVVNYLRVNGWPGAERVIRTGYRVANRTSPDRGDVHPIPAIDGTPGFIIQVKCTGENRWWQVPQWLAETEDQAEAAGADFGILVVHRPGHGHPAEWWAHLYLHHLVGLVGGLCGPVQQPPAAVRVMFRDLLPVLRVAGYGSEPKDVGVAT